MQSLSNKVCSYVADTAPVPKYFGEFSIHTISLETDGCVSKPFPVLLWCSLPFLFLPVKVGKLKIKIKN